MVDWKDQSWSFVATTRKHEQEEPWKQCKSFWKKLKSILLMEYFLVPEMRSSAIFRVTYIDPVHQPTSFRRPMNHACLRILKTRQLWKTFQKMSFQNIIFLLNNWWMKKTFFFLSICEIYFFFPNEYKCLQFIWKRYLTNALKWR